jgi:hypothetical protein
MPDIANVEIFRVGRWNSDDYSVQDLDDMVRNFPLVGFQVPLKIGHAEKSGGRAYGWVRNLRRVGDKLIADFTDIGSDLFRVIKQRGYDQVSSEIFWNLERNGRKFRRVLRAVALLGAEVPGVSGLAPLRTVAHSQRSSSVMSNEHAMSRTDPDSDLPTVADEVDRRTKEIIKRFACEGKPIAYRDAMAIVFSEDPEIKIAYASS